MQGMIESILIRLYGQPRAIRSTPFDEYRWNETDESRRCITYKPMSWDVEAMRRYASLRSLYGDIVGASILRGSLKVSMLRGPEVWNLYQIDALQKQISNVVQRDPDIMYFMDAANVWFYGMKDGMLHVYDSAIDELDVLGPIESEFERLVRDWDAATAANGPAQ